MSDVTSFLDVYTFIGTDCIATWREMCVDTQEK